MSAAPSAPAAPDVSGGPAVAGRSRTRAFPAYAEERGPPDAGRPRHARARERTGAVDAEELRRKLGGFQRGRCGAAGTPRTRSAGGAAAGRRPGGRERTTEPLPAGSGGARDERGTEGGTVEEARR
ncbi:hypothetical protein NKH77_35545 [Streptomyces sp. M19]